jgi:hypothetical protein
VKFKELKSIIHSNFSSSSDSDDSDSVLLRKRQNRPQLPDWVKSPNLKAALKKQQTIDPDSIFSDLPMPNIKGKN